MGLLGEEEVVEEDGEEDRREGIAGRDLEVVVVLVIEGGGPFVDDAWCLNQMAEVGPSGFRGPSALEG